MYLLFQARRVLPKLVVCDRSVYRLLAAAAEVVAVDVFPAAAAAVTAAEDARRAVGGPWGGVAAGAVAEAADLADTLKLVVGDAWWVTDFDLRTSVWFVRFSAACHRFSCCRGGGGDGGGGGESALPAPGDGEGFGCRGAGGSTTPSDNGIDGCYNDLLASVSRATAAVRAVGRLSPVTATFAVAGHGATTATAAAAAAADRHARSAGGPSGSRWRDGPADAEARRPSTPTAAPGGLASGGLSAPTPAAGGPSTPTAATAAPGGASTPAVAASSAIEAADWLEGLSLARAHPRPPPRRSRPSRRQRNAAAAEAARAAAAPVTSAGRSDSAHEERAAAAVPAAAAATVVAAATASPADTKQRQPLPPPSPRPP